MRSRAERGRRLRRSADRGFWISGNEPGSSSALFGAQLLPHIKSSEQSEQENDTGNHRRLDAERKNTGGHCRLQLDIDGYAHLTEEKQARDQEGLIFSLRGQRPPNPGQQKAYSGHHFRYLAGEDRLMGQMTLLNLDFEPSAEWLEEFQKSEHQHQDSQEQRQGPAEATGHFSFPLSTASVSSKTDRSVLIVSQYRQTGLSRVNINSMKYLEKSDPRERILAVADRLFYAEGVRATGTEKIMSVAEVAKATFYRHFESKDALVLAYLENRDQALWDYLSKPTPPKTLREALTRFEQMANWPDITGCPFLRIASEFPDPGHPFHRLAIEHQNKIVDYLTGLLEPYAVDKKAAAAAILSVIDGALSLRMLYGSSKVVPILSPAEAVLKSFQSTRTQRSR